MTERTCIVNSTGKNTCVGTANTSLAMVMVSLKIRLTGAIIDARFVYFRLTFCRSPYFVTFAGNETSYL
ncbi:hypothetical protein EOD41_16870 [Mucilaginibacter limnophilus]|uniref:Uncharacterized protein n=1 Tax=Mucilaginibacter limnophilus TaxID=1932778 RepID=A0A3S2V6L9_9SPHI|nr:hypothetical protein [Mucilaginibacter limnophilus]RVT98461.1 hypothetical protein EOD41_16870 [Mucilaginibacter limnophilus]